MGVVNSPFRRPPHREVLSFGTAALLPIYRHYESPKGRLSDDVRYEFRVGMVF